MERPPLKEAFNRNLVFVSGKGGVGKTAVSQAAAAELNRLGAEVLWATFEDPMKPAGELKEVAPGLWHLNCESSLAFEEYAGLKLGVPALTRVFVRNNLMRYLSQAAPGIHELVLLGKVWFERENYDHVIVDMPSTGYGLAMFQSTRNFARLFRGGPIHKDAERMHETFSSPEETGHVVVALPEEMPLRESIDLDEFLRGLFPDNPAAFVVNRRFPEVGGAVSAGEDSSPFATDATEYARNRYALEIHNLRIWREHGIRWSELPYIPPPSEADSDEIVRGLQACMEERELV